MPSQFTPEPDPNNLPFGSFRADGSTPPAGPTLPGTPTPLGARQVFGGTGGGTWLEELPDSPTINRGEQITVVHRFSTNYLQALDILRNHPRGTLIETPDVVPELYKVLETQVQYSEGDRAVVSITSEGAGGGLDVPPDEYSIEVVEFNPSLLKHPRYAPLTRTQLYYIQAASQSQDFLRLTDFTSVLGTLQNQKNQAATELRIKLQKGIDSFYLAGFKINYTHYSYEPLPMNPGGVIDDPTNSSGVGVPYFFWSLDGTNHTDGGDNVAWVSLAKHVAPVFYANGFTYLRLATTDSYQRTWHRYTESWIAAPAGGTVSIIGGSYQWLGHFDTDIYNPHLPSDTGGVPPTGYNLDPNQ